MKELWWKVRFTWAMWRVCRDLKFSWVSAGVSYPEFPDEDPDYCAQEEMSCWTE